jgi:hypothetical protein
MQRASWWILGLGVLGFLYWKFDPTQADSLFPRCPLFVWTGLKCAGCGSQRAVHSLLHGDLAAAWAYNPMFVLALPYVLVGIWLEYFVPRTRYTTLRQRFFGGKAIVVWGVLLTAYMIARNV